jgi:hypothetical protein
MGSPCRVDLTAFALSEGRNSMPLCGGAAASRAGIPDEQFNSRMERWLALHNEAAAVPENAVNAQ